VKIEVRGSRIEDRPVRSAIRHPLSSILYRLSSIFVLLLLAGCQTPPPAKPEPPPLNYSAYLYTLYDTEWAARPRESLKEDRLELKPQALVVVAKRGEYAPRETLLEHVRAETNFFRRAQGIPAVIEPPTDEKGPQPARVSPEAVKAHLIKMRELAADLRADYMLLVEGVQRVSVNQTPLGIFDLTFIGQFIVGSHRVEVDSKGSAALVDVETGRVMAVATADLRQVTHAPTAALDPRRKRDAEKADAALETTLVSNLMAQLRARLSGQPEGP
jgi:hypothetical protein